MSLSFLKKPEKQIKIVLDSFLGILYSSRILRGLQASKTFEDHLGGIMKCIQHLLLGCLLIGGSLPSLSHAAPLTRIKQESKRSYETPVNKKQEEDIRYIVKTLAFDSLLRIGKSESSLKRAGHRIDHLHPFRFLMTIFKEEELKAGIAAIRDRVSWIKDNFFDGIIRSLKEEAERKNLLQFTSNFAKEVEIDDMVIRPLLAGGKWREFVNTLIDKIPRETDPNRYNM